MAEANIHPTQTSSDWLSIVDHVFPQWRDRLGSGRKAVGKLYDLLYDPETRSAKHRVDASGKEIPDTNRHVDHPGFWQDRLLLVPDADGGDDHLEVDYGDAYLDFYSPGHWEFFVRRLDVERHERQFPELAAPPPRPSASRAPDHQQSRPAEAPPSTAAAPAVSEVATQDASPDVQDVDPFNSGAGGRPSAMEFVLSEAKRRIRDGKVEVRRGKQEEFADALADWWEKERKKGTPPRPKVTAKTIRNNPDFRGLWHQELVRKSQNLASENPETN